MVRFQGLGFLSSDAMRRCCMFLWHLIRAPSMCAATQGAAKTSCTCDCTGFEISTGTNHLGHFLLANSLLEDIQVCSRSFPTVAAEAVAAKADPCTHLLSASGSLLA